MTPPAAFRASYSDWKLIRTRKVVQIVLEVPVEEADVAYQVLGGMPNPAESLWCAVARLEPEKSQPRVKREWKELTPAAQISIRCQERAFRNFLREQFPTAWKQLYTIGPNDTSEEQAIRFVRKHCGVASRADIHDGNPQALDAWQRLEFDYRVWQQALTAA